jgi:uncharacterized protein involved in response to NO
MLLAVMTRALLGHTGRPLVAGPGTTAIYVTLAAILRLLAPLDSAHYVVALLRRSGMERCIWALRVAIWAAPHPASCHR